MHINVYKYLMYVDYDFKLGKSVRVHQTDHCALYLGLQGYSFFICLLLNIDFGYSLKPL